MSVTVIQQPTTPNAAYTKLPFVVSGSGTTSNPQYSYVMDVYEKGGTTLLSRQFTVPNPAGVGVFEPSTIIQGNLQFDYFWKVSTPTAPTSSVKVFDLRFGEAYGTSTSSSVTIYTGSISNYLQVFPGTVDPNEGSYNFNTSSILLPESGAMYFTNSPNFYPISGSQTTLEQEVMYINSTDWGSITMLKDTDPSPSGMATAGYKIESGSISTNLVPNITMYFEFVDGRREFNTLPVGPQNLALTSSAWSASIADPNGINTYQFFGDAGSFIVLLVDKWDGTKPGLGYGEYSNVKYLPKPCNTQEYTRFAWINKYGFWDYYNIYNPLKRSSEVQRNTVELPRVDYSSNLSPYNINSRGSLQYYTDYDDTYTIDTNYIGQDFNTWLEQLLDSPSVYIQRGDEFVPVIITNSSYTALTNENRQKLFNYTITFRPAKGRNLTL